MLYQYKLVARIVRLAKYVKFPTNQIIIIHRDLLDETRISLYYTKDGTISIQLRGKYDISVFSVAFYKSSMSKRPFSTIDIDFKPEYLGKIDSAIHECLDRCIVGLRAKAVSKYYADGEDFIANI